jgi:glutamate/tyrosine decarboxylase-like PLP-dependent enzyme
MDLDRLNAEIIADIQEAGISVPSVTTIDGRLAIRAAVVNHRTETIDADNLIGAVLRAGRQRQTRAA